MDTTNDVPGAASRGELVIPVAKVPGPEEIEEAHRMVEKGVLSVGLRLFISPQ